MHATRQPHRPASWASPCKQALIHKQGYVAVLAGHRPACSHIVHVALLFLSRLQQQHRAPRTAILEPLTSIHTCTLALFIQKTLSLAHDHVHAGNALRVLMRNTPATTLCASPRNYIRTVHTN